MAKIEQLYTNCLAQGAYFIESNGEAAVIDPLRETDPYIELAKERGVKIKYIFETHFHADFVSGHLDLANATGATIVYGPKAETGFDKHMAEDGEQLTIGDLNIQVIHTPGHTPESTSYLLLDEEKKPHCIFTGDTLFIGDVGRPDLAQKATGLTQEDLAGWLFDSLREKIMTLPDDIIVYPAHGAGSACGKNMSSETFDLLGNQKRTNYALRADMTKEEFINEVTTGLAAPPQYFAKNAKLNKVGTTTSISEVMQQGAKALSLKAFELLHNEKDVLLLDVRTKEDFINGFIPGSLFIGLEGSFAPWVGALIDTLDQKIILLTPEGKGEETVRRLARVGFDNTLGYLDGGLKTWDSSGAEIEKINTILVDDFIKVLDSGDTLDILDVRNPSEWGTAHLESALHLSLHDIQNNLAKVNKSTMYHVHCRSGYRSTIAASILHRNGYKNIINVHGSFDDIIATQNKMEGSCPSLLER